MTPAAESQRGIASHESESPTGVRYSPSNRASSPRPISLGEAAVAKLPSTLPFSSNTVTSIAGDSHIPLPLFRIAPASRRRPLRSSQALGRPKFGEGRGWRPSSLARSSSRSLRRRAFFSAGDSGGRSPVLEYGTASFFNGVAAGCAGLSP